ncbi:chitin deacetylase 7-like [Liolophura sinensis]|uniref:chitin deacetylase 7-like n=1 Tax=Liolophura sinensis TaxID=3198878 RepID=UPI003158752D
MVNLLKDVMVRATLDLLLMFLVLLWTLNDIRGSPVSHHDNCKMGINCHLPNCLCRSYDTPGDLNKTHIPQIVLFTFEGPLDARAYKMYQELFPSTRRNPNGCPARITLFLQGNTTDYSLAADMYERGVAELGVSSMSTQPKDYWQNVSYDTLRDEVYAQKMLIHKRGNVPLPDIKGYRSPYLQPSHALYEMLGNVSLGFEYDSSLAILKSRLGEDVEWPFTLDFGFQKACDVPPCPTFPLMGVWEFPVYSLIDLDGFPNVDHSKFFPLRDRAAFRYLVQNFRTFYRRNKTPFILNLRPEWFYHNHTMSATKRFLDRLLSLPERDIYLLALSDALEWVKSPRDTPDSTNFTAWKCSRADIDPAPVAPPTPGTAKPSKEPWCLSINGVVKCEERNPPITAAATTETTTTQSSPSAPPSSTKSASTNTLPTTSSLKNHTLCPTDAVMYWDDAYLALFNTNIMADIDIGDQAFDDAQEDNIIDDEQTTLRAGGDVQIGVVPEQQTLDVDLKSQDGRLLVFTVNEY